MEYSRRSRGLAVEFALLGFLVESPAHGYELRDRLSAGLGAFWRIASSQLYQVLHRLEEEGWVDASVEAGATGPSRTVYHITEKGRSAFWSWAASPVRHVRRIRVEFLAKLYFLRRLAPERLPEVIRAQIAVLRELQEHMHRRPHLRTDDALLGALASSYRRNQVEATIRWLEENEQRIAEGKENE